MGGGDRPRAGRQRRLRRRADAGRRSRRSWVKNETNAAIELDNRGEVRFIPLDVAACTVPTLWNVYQRVPFRGRYEDGLAALLRRLGTSGRAAAEAGRQRRRRGTRRQVDKETKPEVAVQKPQAAEPPRIEVAASALRLSGAQVQELMASLLDAYDESSLRQMVRFQLDEHLDLIAGGGNLSQVVFNLIAWAERTGRIAELIAKAQAYNPGNARLAAFARSLPGIAVVEPAKVAPQALPAAPAQAPPRRPAGRADRLRLGHHSRRRVPDGQRQDRRTSWPTTTRRRSTRCTCRSTASPACR